jgi:hypothetical protein
MQKTRKTGFLIGCCLLAVAGLMAAAQETMVDIFPEIPGFQKKGAAEIFEPDNLFEYIDGAADVYLSYDFQELGTLSYENAKKQSITVDIYRHSNSDNGFGIYSQEKPTDGNFIPIGTQGYYEEGNLIFFKDRYYVKLSGFDLQGQDRQILEKTASLIDKKLEGKPVFPLPLACFPEKGKIKNSERFILRNFLGHAFLHSAFVCDYRIVNQQFQIFIIQAASQKDVQAILDDYAGFMEKKGSAFQADSTGGYRFQDPYYRSRGNMNLKKKGRFIWGLFSDNLELSRFYMDNIEQNLIARKLIQ